MCYVSRASSITYAPIVQSGHVQRQRVVDRYEDCQFSHNIMYQEFQAGSQTTVRLMIPDMPNASEIGRWLEQIDFNRHYTNFGPLVTELETRIEGRLRAESLELLPGASRVVTASSGTAALELAITARRLRPCAKVALPAFTFPATATAVIRSGAVPVFVDVDPDSWCLTPEIALDVLEYTDVDLVIPVAAFGRPLPAADWDRFAEGTGIPVIMDAASAFGSQVLGRVCVTVFSLHATKAMSSGEGGLVAACSDTFIHETRQLSNFGFSAPRRVGSPGLNGKLSEYHAAVGLAQLERFGEVRERRARVYAHYAERLSQLDGRVALQHTETEFVRSVLPVAVLGMGGAERLEVGLQGEKIETRRWYCPPLNEHRAFLGMQCAGRDGSSDLPVTTSLSEQILGLPFHSFLSEFEIARVCSLVEKHHGSPRAFSMQGGAA